MAVNRPDIVKAKILKQRSWHHHAFGVGFKAFGQLQQRWRDAQYLLAYVAG